MGNMVLYEVSPDIGDEIRFDLMLISVCLLLMIGMAIAGKRGYKKAKIGIAIGAFGLAIQLAGLLLMMRTLSDMYRGIIVPYERGDYQIVEGYVEDFHPMPQQGHDQESFTVEGVKFSYSDFVLQYGYHNARSRGGVITGNGQHLRIGYTRYSYLGNVIVYIEELIP